MRLAVFRALGRLGTPAVPALVGLLKQKDDEVRRSAAVTLGTMKEAAKEAVPTLLEALADESNDADTRGASAESLGLVGGGDQKLVSTLIRFLGDPHPELSSGASLGLGHIGAPAMSALIKVLKEGNIEERTCGKSARQDRAFGDGTDTDRGTQGFRP